MVVLVVLHSPSQYAKHSSSSKRTSTIWQLHQSMQQSSPPLRMIPLFVSGAWIPNIAISRHSAFSPEKGTHGISSVWYVFKRYPTGISWVLHLAQAFHDTGRYILSAGHDQIINLVMFSACLYTSSDINSSQVDCSRSAY